MEQQVIHVLLVEDNPGDAPCPTPFLTAYLIPYWPSPD